MIEENGRVVRVTGDTAWVETTRRSSCGSCSARSGCGTGALAGLFGARAHLVQVTNPVGARPGDQVVVGISESLLVRGSLAVYLLPLLTLLAGALLAEGLAPQLGGTGSDAPAIFGGLTGLAAGFLWLHRRNRRWQADPAHRAVILRRMSPSAPINLVSGTHDAN